MGEIRGIGEITGQVIEDVLADRMPAYLERLESEAASVPPSPAMALRAQLRGDCHTHTDWSDGKSSVAEMAEAARALGHEYLVITDHSPRLKGHGDVARVELFARGGARPRPTIERVTAAWVLRTGTECRILPSALHTGSTVYRP